MSQPTLFDVPVNIGMPKNIGRTPAAFDGETIDGALDGARLERLLDRVRDYMLSGEWRTLADIQAACGGTEASVSARLRDLRKDRFGGHQVDRRRVPGTDPRSGLWHYRVRAGKQVAA